MSASRPVVCYSDVGGTFTDCFVVTESGEYALGKAPTTPDDIASGFIAALDMARDASVSSGQEFLDSLEVVGYGATTVLNSLLTRRGGEPGLLITRGFEDLLLMERGKQSWVQLSRVDRIHPVSHRHQRPLIARQRVKGVSERVNSLGAGDHPAPRAGRARGGHASSVAAGVDSIVVVYMWSFLNDEHEQRTKQLIAEELELARPHRDPVLHLERGQPDTARAAPRERDDDRGLLRPVHVCGASPRSRRT